jgi:cell division inhibitor SepF
MDNFDEKYNINRVYGEDSYEYYEDTHDENGEYTKRLQEFTAQTNVTRGVGREDSFTPRPNNIVAHFDEVEDNAKQEKKEERVVSFADVVMFEPIVEKDAETIIKHIKSGEPAVLNMSDCNGDVAQRVLDFVSGATFALDGIMRKVASKFFISVPKGVKVITTEDGE